MGTSVVLQKLIRKLMTIFYHLLYHQFAWSYDFVAWAVSLGQWKSWALTPIQYLKSGRILELGFGPGHLQKSAHGRGLAIFGIDLSPQMAHISSRRLVKGGYPHGLSIGDGRQLPFAKQTFNQIVATFPSDYFLDPRTWKEARRVLVPAGEFILVPMAWIRGDSAIHKFLAWVFKITGQSLEKEHPLLDSGKKFIEDQGFEVSMHFHNFEHSEVLVIIAKKI